MEKDKLQRIEEKLDKINDKLGEINVTLAENTQSLIIHEKRTDIAEKKLALLEIEFKEKSARDELIMDGIERKIEPVHDHVLLLNILVKYIIPALAGLVAFLYKFGIFKF